MIRRLAPTSTRAGALWRDVFVRWIPANVAGGAFALGLGDFSSGVGLLRGTELSDTSGWYEAWTVVVAGALAGIVLGAAQGIALGRIARPGGDIEIRALARRWLTATTGALTIGFPLIWVLGGAGGGEAFAHHALPHVLDPAGSRRRRHPGRPDRAHPVDRDAGR
ncbi:MAG: hypothetical protein ACR2NO_05070 [Chloroflexota bacterium]